MRIDGRPLGLEANDPAHLAGAIDRLAAIKPARVMKLCTAHNLVLHFRCYQPGNRVAFNVRQPELAASSTTIQQRQVPVRTSRSPR